MERNKLTYQQMIDLLKDHQYEAPNNWTAIAEDLALSESLTKLPQHQAPDHLWEGIEESLDSPVDTSPNPSPQDNKHLQYLKGAGLIILLLTATIIYLLTKPAPTEYQYRSETEQSSVNESKALAMDGDLDEVLMYIRANEFIFSPEELQKFERQLAELKAAIKAIQEMKEKYGQDEHSNKLLARIERDRTDLLKAMIAATS